VTRGKLVALGAGAGVLAVLQVFAVIGQSSTGPGESERMERTSQLERVVVVPAAPPGDGVADYSVVPERRGPGPSGCAEVRKRLAELAAKDHQAVLCISRP
jgi:hypothetical protein